MVWDEDLGYDIDNPDTFEECLCCDGMGIVPLKKENKLDMRIIQEKDTIGE